MTRVLLTGFEPFAGDAVNPSEEAVHLVASRWSGPEELITAVLPVTFGGAAARMRELLAEHRPDVVIATGLAGGRSAIGVERVAINLADARIPDNAGFQPTDEPSVPGAPAAHFSTLPVKSAVHAVLDSGTPAEVSYSAGTFVCNHTFFALLDAAPEGVRAGFVHVPWSIEHAPQGAPALTADAIARAVEITVRVSLDAQVDEHLPGGTLH